MLLKNSTIVCKLVNGQTTIENVVMCQKKWEQLIFTRNIPDALTASRLATPTLASLKNYGALGEHSAFIVLIALIKEVADNINVGKSLNDAQLGFAAKMIYNEYYYFKISEIRYAFLQGIMGQYGQTFDRIDVSVLINWLSQYDEERMTIINDKTNSFNKNTNESVFLKDASSDIKEAFSKLFDNLNKQTGAKKDKAAMLIYEYCEANNLEFNDCLNRFIQQYEQLKETMSFDSYIEQQLKHEVLKIKILRGEK